MRPILALAVPALAAALLAAAFFTGPGAPPAPASTPSVSPAAGPSATRPGESEAARPAPVSLAGPRCALPRPSRVAAREPGQALATRAHLEGVATSRDPERLRRALHALEAEALQAGDTARREMGRALVTRLEREADPAQSKLLLQALIRLAPVLPFEDGDLARLGGLARLATGEWARAGALWVLAVARRHDSAQQEALLVSALEGDRSALVRQTALDGLAKLGRGPLGPVAQASLLELAGRVHSSGLRHASLAVLRQRGVPEGSPVAASLGRLAEGETDPGLRAHLVAATLELGGARSWGLRWLDQPAMAALVRRWVDLERERRRQ